MVGQGQVEDDMGEGLVDASDRIEGGDVIVYWNDIEKDKRYQNWPIHPQGVSNCVFFKKIKVLAEEPCSTCALYILASSIPSGGIHSISFSRWTSLESRPLSLLSIPFIT